MHWDARHGSVRLCRQPWNALPVHRSYIVQYRRQLLPRMPRAGGARPSAQAAAIQSAMGGARPNAQAGLIARIADRAGLPARRPRTGHARAGSPFAQIRGSSR